MRASDDVIDAIRTHAEKTYPEECCGLLLGSLNDGENVVADALAVENRNEDRRVDRYVIDPSDYRKVDLEARKLGLDVVGIYHSHPDHPAEPSQTDLQQATFPGYTYVIVSVVDGVAADLTAWSLARDRSRFLSEDVVRASKVRTKDKQ